MHRPTLGALLALFLLTGCLRTFEAAPLDQPGTLSGRALSLGLTGQWVPAVGAQASLLSTSVQAVAGSDGRFLLTGVTQSGGRLLLSYSPMGAGSLDQQVLVSLDAIATGPGIQAQLGDIQLAATGGVSGHLNRIDQPDVGMQAGTTVYVPGAPFLTLTGPDGSFDLSPLPSGALPLVAFRTGYVPLDFGQVDISAGQQLLLPDHVLTLDTSSGTGSITGRVVLAGTSSIAGVTVEADGNFASQAGMLSADGSFTVPGLASGLYTLSVSAPGYETATVPNLLVLPNQPDAIGTVSLAQGGSSSTASTSRGTTSTSSSGTGTSSGGTSASGGMCTPPGEACSNPGDCCETSCETPPGGLAKACCDQSPSGAISYVACKSSLDCCGQLVCDDGGFGSAGRCCIPSASASTCSVNADCCDNTCYSGGTCNPPDAGCYNLGENCGASTCCLSGICEAGSQVCCIPIPSLNSASPGAVCNGDATCCSGLICHGGTAACCIPPQSVASVICHTNSDCCPPMICSGVQQCAYNDAGP